MASLIVCTPGGGSDNCYVTLAFADAHFADTLRADTWEKYLPADREKALIQATQDIERQGGARAAGGSRRAKFLGVPIYNLTSQQSLHFPRVTDVDDGGSFAIPRAVQEAVCEQAWFLLWQRDNPDLIDRGDLQRQGVRSVSVAGVSETYGPASVPEGIATEAWDLIRPYIRHNFNLRV